MKNKNPQNQLSIIEKSLFLFLLLIFVVLFTSAFSSPTYSRTDEVRRITIGAEALDAGVNPLGQTTWYGVKVNRQLFNALVTDDYTGVIHGDIAKEWDISEDGKYWTFYLREGVLFHNGQELTAEDVKFSFDWALNPENGFTRRGRIDMVESVEIIDDYTVVVSLKRPSAPFLEGASTVTILPKEVFEKDPEGFSLNPVGTGPFQLKEWRHGDRVILEAFDDFFLGRPQIDELVYRVIPEGTVRVAELEKGGIDLMQRVPGHEIPRLEGKPQLEIVKEVSSQYREIAINNQRPPWDDVRVRQALSYALDREVIVNIVWPGVVEAAKGPITPNSWAFDPNVWHYDYNPERARELLKEAGYSDGFRVEYIISTREGEDREAAIIQQQAAEVGIQVDIVPLEWSTLVNRLLACDFDLLRVGITQNPDPDTLMYQWYHSEAKPPSGWNFLLYENKKVDELLEEGRVTFDLEERTRLYQEAERLLMEDAPAVWLYYELRVYGVSDRVNGFYPHHGGYYSIKTAYGADVSID